MENNVQTTNSAAALVPIAATPVEMRLDPVRFPRLNSIHREDAIRLMTEIVRAACIYRGSKAEASDVVATAAALVDELNADTAYGLKFISFAEIRRAVRRAVLETEMYGVNVASLYRAIVAYAKGEGTQATIAAQTQRSGRPSSPQIALDAAASELLKNHLVK
jgi:hypothetical protein